MTCPARTADAGSGRTRIRSPGANAGRMLPESTVSTRNQPSRGAAATATSTATAATVAAVRVAPTSRRTPPRRVAPGRLTEGRGIALSTGLLVRAGPLGAGEGVLDHRGLVLQGVARARGQRQRHPQVVGGP